MLILKTIRKILLTCSLVTCIIVCAQDVYDNIGQQVQDLIHEKQVEDPLSPYWNQLSKSQIDNATNRIRQWDIQMPKSAKNEGLSDNQINARDNYYRMQRLHYAFQQSFLAREQQRFDNVVNTAAEINAQTVQPGIDNVQKQIALSQFYMPSQSAREALLAERGFAGTYIDTTGEKPRQTTLQRDLGQGLLPVSRPSVDEQADEKRELTPQELLAIYELDQNALTEDEYRRMSEFLEQENQRMKDEFIQLSRQRGDDEATIAANVEILFN